MAYDRLLERLYLLDEGWIIKEATALLAHDIGVRGTVDIDLYREVAREIAEADLRQAAALDLGDWFRFEIGAPRPLADQIPAVSASPCRPSWGIRSGPPSTPIWLEKISA
jgi:hypothetical protein